MLSQTMSNQDILQISSMGSPRESSISKKLNRILTRSNSFTSLRTRSNTFPFFKATNYAETDGLSYSDFEAIGCNSKHESRRHNSCSSTNSTDFEESRSRSSSTISSSSVFSHFNKNSSKSTQNYNGNNNNNNRTLFDDTVIIRCNSSSNMYSSPSTDYCQDCNCNNNPAHHKFETFKFDSRPKNTFQSLQPEAIDVDYQQSSDDLVAEMMAINILERISNLREDETNQMWNI